MRTVLLLLLGAVAAGAELRPYQIQPDERSRVELSVEKTGLMKGKIHRFLFGRYHGVLEYDSETPENSRVGFSVESQSAVCQDNWVSPKDLQKIQEFAVKEMLAAERYPRIEFVSTAVRLLAPARFEVTGTLTIRDRVQPASVTVTLDKTPDGNLRLAGTAHLRLTEFGLKPPSAALGTVGTKDEMRLEFSLVARPGR